ncbi:MAG TPA: pyrroloquinoline quinone biosynthesis protein C [Gammaproteobacteria bacterium]|nr:pyrroloquinoline quinone biosynthesis protein C [Gammaproteobacteria bacterium]
MSAPWTKDAFEQKLRALGSRYHIYHPYQVMMNEGQLDRHQIQGWVANRYYYQIKIPQKDASLMANCPDRDVRRAWIQRILDHDGEADDPGGIEAWIQLGLATGLSREQITSQQMVLPGVRFAVDAYVNFVRQASWQEGICSSLTELFAPQIHQQRIANWPSKYPWIDDQGLNYFRNRVQQANRDVEHGLALTLEYFNTIDLQHRALQILQFKLEVLWSMLDAMYMAYINKMPPFYGTQEPDL